MFKNLYQKHLINLLTLHTYCTIYLTCLMKVEIIKKKYEQVNISSLHLLQLKTVQIVSI